MPDSAKNVILKCGHGSFALGVRFICAALTVNKSCVYRWTYPRERGGSGGVIPGRHQSALLNAAHKSGIDLAAEDFFSGGSL